MKCRIAKQMIHLHIDQELDLGQEKLLSDHIESCVSCRMYLARMKETKEWARAVPPVPVPPSLHYLVNAEAHFAQVQMQSAWFNTLQFRMLTPSYPERFKTAFVAIPITCILFLLVSMLIYRPNGFGVIEPFADSSSQKNHLLQENLVERSVLQNMYEFSPETFSNSMIYQPRISMVPVKLFAENEFQSMGIKHLGILTCVRSDGSTEIVQVEGGGKPAKDKVRHMLDSSIVFPAIFNGHLIESNMIMTFDMIVVKG